MPVFVKLDEERDLLTVKLAGLKGSEFGDALRRVKSIPGKRYDPDRKLWLFEASADTAMRLMYMVQPVPDAKVKEMIQGRQVEIAEQLVTKLPDDASLQLHHTWAELAEKLKPFQRSAIDWFQAHPSSILADEMGAGKTIEALGTLWEWECRNPEENGARPTLIVCAGASVGVWADEIEHGPLQEVDPETGEPKRGTNFRVPIIEDWPQRSYRIIDGNAGRRVKLLDEPADFYIVNWEKLQDRVDLLKHLRKREWAAIFADEAHRAKNRKAQQTRALFKLDAAIKLAITGSPVMVSPDDLWSLLRWTHPEIYSERVAGGGFWPFHNSYVDEIPTEYGPVMTGVKNVDGLRFELHDKMVRRTKKEVLPDLPDKLPPRFVPVEFTPAERKVYQKAEKELFLDIATWIRDTVANPALGESEKELMESIVHLPLENLAGLIPNGAARIGKLRQITSAAKVKAAEEIIRDANEPVVTFFSYINSCTQLADKLEAGKPSQSVARIWGDVKPAPLERAFQAGEWDHVVATIEKGGESMTLHRSRIAILGDRHWVPRRNDQAVDRLHRQGQEAEVSTIILEVRGTVDDGKVAESNRFKTMIEAQTLGAAA